MKTLIVQRSHAVGSAGKERANQLDLRPISVPASLKGRLTAMPDEVQIAITRADLPRADVAFGLDEKDFDLTKIYQERPSRERPKQDPIKLTAPLGDGPGTIVATTEGASHRVISYADKGQAPTADKGSPDIKYCKRRCGQSRSRYQENKPAGGVDRSPRPTEL